MTLKEKAGLWADNPRSKIRFHIWQKNPTNCISLALIQSIINTL